MSRRGACLIGALVLCCALAPQRMARSSHNSPLVTEVDPGAMVIDRAGNLWFTENRGLERMTQTGTFRLFAVPGLSGYFDETTPNSLAVGPGDSIWFTSGGRIGRLDKQGVLTLFRVPATLGTPDGLTRGPHGTLWCVLTRGNTNTLARVSSSGTVIPVVQWPRPGHVGVFGGRINGLTVGADGKVWFTATHVTDQTEGFGPSFAGYVDPHTYKVTRFPLPRFVLGVCPWDDCIPLAMTVGMHGAAWFGMFGSGLGRVTPSGKVQMYPLPRGIIAPTTLALGPDGAIWFGTIGAWIGRIGRQGALTWTLITHRWPEVYDGLTFDSAHRLWFTVECKNSVGRLAPGGKVSLFHIPGTAKDAGQECPTLP